MWAESVGVGYLPLPPRLPYDEAYFEKYLGYEGTMLGRAITRERVELVNRYTLGKVIDIGVGSGAFLKARPNTTGFDINPAAVAWLKMRGTFEDPLHPDGISTRPEALTFWDSLEHIPDFGPLLAIPRTYVFVSTPIYRSLGAVLGSRHFRPDEHCWYWTKDGLRRHLAHYGFHPVYETDFETILGRDSIGTFVFSRRAP